MLNTHIGLLNIWKNHPYKEKEIKIGPKVEILALLRKREMSEREVKEEISEGNQRNIITVLRAMTGKSGYRKTIARRLNGNYYILTEFKKTISGRILGLLTTPMKGKEILDSLPDLERASVRKILNRLLGTGGYIKKLRRSNNGFYSKVE